MQYPANRLKTNGTSILILNIKKKYIWYFFFQNEWQVRDGWLNRISIIKLQTEPTSLGMDMNAYIVLITI